MQAEVQQAQPAFPLSPQPRRIAQRAAPLWPRAACANNPHPPSWKRATREAGTLRHQRPRRQSPGQLLCHPLGHAHRHGEWHPAAHALHRRRSRQHARNLQQHRRAHARLQRHPPAQPAHRLLLQRHRSRPRPPDRRRSPAGDKLAFFRGPDAVPFQLVQRKKPLL